MARKYNQAELLTQLKTEVKSIIDTVQGMNNLGEAQLNQLPEAGKWSIAQVVEHLNTYNRYYVPRIAAAVAKAPQTGSSVFNAGWLGDYFTRSMYSEVVTGKKVANKMSAMKGHIPAATLNGAAVLEEFITTQRQLLQLLEDMAGKHMSAIRIPITISKLIRISYGDAVRFLVAHHVRHQLQMQHVLAIIHTN